MSIEKKFDLGENSSGNINDINEEIAEDKTEDTENKAEYTDDKKADDTGELKASDEVKTDEDTEIDKDTEINKDTEIKIDTKIDTKIDKGTDIKKDTDLEKDTVITEIGKAEENAVKEKRISFRSRLKEAYHIALRIIGLLTAVGGYIYFILNKSFYIETPEDIYNLPEEAESRGNLLTDRYFLTLGKTLQADGNSIYIGRIVVMSVMAVLLILLILYHNKLRAKADRALGIVVSLMGIPLSFYASEYIIRYDIDDIMLTGPVYFFLNLLIISFIYIVFLAITNSYKAAPIMLSVLLLVFSVINFFVFQYRGVPVMAADFAIVGTAAAVADSFSLSMNFSKLFCIYLVFLYIVFMHKFHNTKAFRLRYRIPFTALAATCVFIYVSGFCYGDLLGENNLNVYLRMFRPMTCYQDYGTALALTRSINYSIVKKPDGYSLYEVKKIMDPYMKEDDTTHAVVKPNIISIIDETFSDISCLGDFETNEEVLPYINSIQPNSMRGTCYSSVVGGGTANSEFEYLTGNSMAFLPSQSVAFQLYIHHPMESFVRYAEAEGYTGNIAWHPFVPTNYNRPKVYPYLGFQKYLSGKDIKDIPYKRMRHYITDRSSFDKIIQLYEKSKTESDKPFFIYNMTIQNHTPYDKNFPNFKEPVQILGDKKDSQANMYLNCVAKTDKAVKHLVNYFQNKKDPTVIVFFGDHQPRITDRFFELITDGKCWKWDDEQMMVRYQVPLRIWANFDIGTDFMKDTSINFIQANLLDKLGLPTTPFQKFQLEFEKHVPVLTANGYYGIDGSYYKVNDTTSPYYKWIHKYQLIQYNNMFDTKNTVHDFFEIKE
ncbi:MAG: LTA synthase family protein [Lachnospiraceae bacterium]|jgi:phosphoglycerol transferase MdoB-like AlkP superfamily enzyme|nr:LTA synthase family protein [Lachnospiraceae bacterium]MEE3462056.1 LTA synthase family protein [Lachnospiraceae bacterium]